MANRKDRHGVALRPGEYERPNNKGYQYVYKDASGKRQTISAPSLAELREKEKTVQLNTLLAVKSPAQMTVNDAYKRWIQVKRGLKANTKSNYIYMYEKYVMPDFGRRKLKTIKRSDVKAFYNSLIKSEDNPSGLQVNTMDTIHQVLHQIFGVMVDDEYIRYNPADNCMKELRMEFKPKKRKGLTHAEQERFIKFLSDSKEFEHWFPIFYFMLSSGLRVGELTALRWEDIDRKNRIIHVRNTLVYYKDEIQHKQMYRMNSTKTEAGTRDIPLSGACWTALLFLLIGQGKDFKSVSVIDGYSGFVFTNRFGQVYHQGTLNRALRERIIPAANAEAERLGLTILPPFSCHNLRHTYCVNLCEANVDLKTIQTLMGHSDIRTTMNIYAEATKEMKVKASATVDEYHLSLIRSNNEADKPEQ